MEQITVWPASGQTKPGHWRPTIAGGVRRLTMQQLGMAWWLYQAGHLNARQTRIYFALHEMRERRSWLKSHQKPVYSLAELRKLIGAGQGGPISDRALRRDLRRLAALGMAHCTEQALELAVSADQVTVPDLTGFWEFFNRLPRRVHVPVPRRVLREWAGGLPRALLATMMAVVIRSLFWHASENAFRVDGRTKASWIAETFGVSLRSAKNARTKLVELGWLEPLSANQWQLNRWGGHFAIHTDWQRGEVIHSPTAAPTSVSAPPSAEITPHSAPPCLNENLPEEGNLKTSIPANPGPSRAGVCKKAHQDEERVGGIPKLTDIRLENLKRTEDLIELHRQAAERGVIGGGEGGLLDFVSLAERALTHGHEPCRLFAWLVSHGRTDFVTQSDEDAANARLKRHLYQLPRDFAPVASSPPSRAELSADAQIANVVLAAMAQGRVQGDPLDVLRQNWPGWTRQRWENAVEAYYAWRREQ